MLALVLTPCKRVGVVMGEKTESLSGFCHKAQGYQLLTSSGSWRKRRIVELKNQ